MQKTASLIQPRNALVLIILLNLIFAGWIGNQFGIAWDEPNYYLYGERSYDAYLRGLSGRELNSQKNIFFFDLRYYGPFYAVTGWLTANALTPLLNNWHSTDISHFANFVFFQLALIALYDIAKRFMQRWTAILVVLLFATQPLLFGHAFINPKDIPFMTFFLVSMALGLRMIDGFKTAQAHESESNLIPFPQFDLLVAILSALLIFTIVGKDLIDSWIGAVISAIYNAPRASIGGQLFSILSDPSRRLPLDSYIHKAIAAGLDQKFIVAALLLIVVKKIVDEYKHNSTINLTELYKNLNWNLIASILLAGIMLGLTTSIRILAPFAGLIIFGYAFASVGKKSIPNLIVYFSLAALTSYLTWPFLWAKPAANFLEAFNIMRSFPYSGGVRFMGDNISPSNLPWFYLPLLIGIQTTEPVLILFIVGLMGSLWKLVKKQTSSFILTPIYVWLFIPVLLQITFRTNAYDNFRQFIFVLPPLFILAGIGLEEIFRRISRPSVRYSLSILALLPGLVGIVSLHPYEYIYYNSFIGGMRGAGNRFETDYWLTSYREAAIYLNENAPAKARILVWGGSYSIREYGRKDLSIYDFNSQDEINEPYDYAVISTRFGSDLSIFPEAKVVYEVKKNGVLLSVVKKLDGQP